MWTNKGMVPWQYLSESQKEEIRVEFPDIVHEQFLWSREADEVVPNEIKFSF